MFEEMKPEELYKRKAHQQHTIVDVRSPKEFHQSTIPGSLNIPVFTDEERSEVGTIYKQVGPEAAKERGLAIFSNKLPGFIAAFQKINTPITVFCWRGGMRSKTAATVVDLMGIKNVTRLTGGIRAYREWTVSLLDEFDFRPELIVLNGGTGNGKTMILEKLRKEGYPVINLEEMAGHRGSIFGQIGLEPKNQRAFDFQLLEKLLEYQNEPFVFLEGESKRIGKVTLPERLYRKKEASRQLFIELPMEKRVANILEDYQPWKYPEKFKEAFQLIKRHIHTPVAKEIEQCLESGEFAVAVELLLMHYYDPRYEHSSDYPENRQTLVQAKSVEDAIERIKREML
ncbi:tRNA 2-selenouridine(34) synthase MnmH [Radiobacillus kanasensis]|uniref:tRNA 2-selenouridine(34) synthase MnmH n=1 Tax=Radiobacillus kanasensis TaxID=2844358 RepID=UPI001E292D2D|nr:tRNA 2-selenouridine(34) synthase MnmH [Radiobacillus kanasensis]UFT99355.1 tRNA 2-selenouridine(34) synthase MnmH [Radiobacillus kanasensis]